MSDKAGMMFDDPVAVGFAGLLSKAIGELESVRKQLKHVNANKVQVDVSIARIEEEMRRQANQLASSSRQTRSARSGPVGSTVLMQARGAPEVQRTHIHSSPSLPQTNLLLKNPTSRAARAYLEERYGIEQPSRQVTEASRPAGGATMAGQLMRGLSDPAQPSVVLPKHLRENPFNEVPRELAEQEVSRGLFHLVNKGLLPPNADLTDTMAGGSAPMKAGRATVHEHYRQFDRPPLTTALEDHILAREGGQFKLDLLTPVMHPQDVAKPPDQMHQIQIGVPPTVFDGLGGTSPTWPPPPPPPDERGFDALMDQYALHEFMIRKGSVVEDTPEFRSFLRTCADEWEAVSHLLLQLEGICSQYDVPLAIISGKMLLELASKAITTGEQPNIGDTLRCIKNIEEVAVLLRHPARRYNGPGGQQEAATAIQSVFRGHLARRKADDLREEAQQRAQEQEVAVREIQAAWRNSRMRQDLTRKMNQARKQRSSKLEALQSSLVQQWRTMQRSHHVVIHLPSLSMQEHLRQGLGGKLVVLEGLQLARLCDLTDPLVEVVVVVPGPVDEEVQAYWERLLHVGGVDDAGSRYRLVFPENHGRLPQHMSTAAKLLASPRALRRLRMYCSGRLAYMLPDVVGGEEADLAVELGVPILGPTPMLARTLSSKAAARALFRGASMNLPPGGEIPPRKVVPRQQPHDPSNTPLRPGTGFQFGPGGEIVATEPEEASTSSSFAGQLADEASVMRCIAEVMVGNIGVQRWLIKIDDEIMGRGHAHFETASIKGALDIYERFLQLLRVAMVVLRVLCRLSIVLRDMGGAQSGASALLRDAREVAVAEIAGLLLRQLPRRLQIVARDAYSGYPSYLAALISRGGVIEASPMMVMGSPQVNMFVDPKGAVRVLSTHERVFCPAFRGIGTSFPQSSVPHMALQEAGTAIGAACHKAGLIGHVAVDFVTLREGSQLRLWAVGLTPRITHSLLSYQLFDFLSAGKFSPTTGTYSLDASDQPAASSSSNQAGSAAAAGAATTSRRCFVQLDLIQHPYLDATPYGTFFHTCWQKGISFDVDTKVGTVFNISAGVLAKATGLLCIGSCPADCFSELASATTCIHHASEAVGTASTDSQAQLAQFHSMHSTVKYLAEHLRTLQAGSKQPPPSKT